MMKPKDQRREAEDTSALSRALRETCLSEEPSTAAQVSSIEPSEVPVEELADYYNSTNPPGRKYPEQSMSDWDNLYIDDSHKDPELSADEDNIMKGKGETGKQPAKITGIKGTKSQATKQSRSKAETKAEMMSQPSLAKDKKAKGKSKKTEEDEDEEDEDEEGEEKKKKKEWTPPRYHACNECHIRAIRCHGADKTTKSDDWLCTPCRLNERECHFSVIGLRHLSAKK